MKTIEFMISRFIGIFLIPLILLTGCNLSVPEKAERNITIVFFPNAGKGFIKKAPKIFPYNIIQECRLELPPGLADNFFIQYPESEWNGNAVLLTKANDYCDTFKMHYIIK